jgi:hypothetical protein
MEINFKSRLMSIFRIIDHASASADVLKKNIKQLSLSDSDKQSLKVIAQPIITYKLKQQHAEK